MEIQQEKFDLPFGRYRLEMSVDSVILSRDARGVCGCNRMVRENTLQAFILLSRHYVFNAGGDYCRALSRARVCRNFLVCRCGNVQDAGKELWKVCVSSINFLECIIEKTRKALLIK